ncbi:MAG: hypothetical protein LBT20_06340 [Clostridiales bacterium]|jgi:beta-galactosidase|nr:hypothetical protein [Clostridiales bacterium]
MIKKRYIWEDPTIILQNKEDGHSLAFCYDHEEDAIQRRPSAYRLDLNGKWKFNFHYGAEENREFYEKGFDDSEWEEIQVPGVWQTQGYSKPIYYGASYPTAFPRTPNIKRIFLLK